MSSFLAMVAGTCFHLLVIDRVNFTFFTAQLSCGLVQVPVIPEFIGKFS
jgi:hypothetical protein